MACALNHCDADETADLLPLVFDVASLLYAQFASLLQGILDRYSFQCPDGVDLNSRVVNDQYSSLNVEIKLVT